MMMVGSIPLNTLLWLGYSNILNIIREIGVEVLKKLDRIQRGGGAVEPLNIRAEGRMI